MNKLILILCFNLLNFMGYSNIDSRIIYEYESGKYSLDEIKNIYGNLDLINFIGFIENYWFAYNENVNAIFENRLSSISIESTWYYTAMYIRHFELCDLTEQELNQLRTIAFEKDSLNENIYLKIFVEFEKYQPICDQTEFYNFIIQMDSQFSFSGFYQDMKADAFASIGDYEKSMKAANSITYKQHKEIQSFIKFRNYLSMNKIHMANNELEYIIDTLGCKEYIIEKILNIIYTRGDLNIAEKLLNNSNLNSGSLFYFTQGLLFEAQGHYEKALDSFIKLYQLDSRPGQLLQYLWLCISLRKYERFEQYLNDKRLQNYNWFIAYKIVFLVESKNDLEDAISLLNELDECNRNEVMVTLEPFTDVVKLLETE